MGAIPARTALLVAALWATASALDNGVGKTPAMGWNSWNYFRCNINETIIKQVADAIVSSGLKDAGFVYVNIGLRWRGWRGPWTESKVSLALNIAMAVLLALLVAQPRRRAAAGAAKSSRDLQ
ncbi:putative alpha-galactosidase [Tetrabaena socialis]|uniref:Alpha-galactosidase n=1 Tax=Tetrabaena socialis TaxID=47790 RepID=A0A2J7ZPK5_9CHLO|nr:putative alpha-galactosidase [Tetrabaena socialis]|eukprot:PNH02182.1 putative alpha-galactosidase [Tetrabaena socialis]